MSDDRYDDDRPGAMRVHVAQERARLACDIYYRDRIRSHAKAKGVRARRGSMTMMEIATDLALAGYVRADGKLRDGWPT